MTVEEFYAKRELAMRYHRLLLVKILIEYPPPYDCFGLKCQTFRLYEKKVDDICDGKYSEEEIAYLESLPDSELWVSDAVENLYETYMYNNSPYFKLKPENINDILIFN